jgi:ATP-dependent exoDNAse (exonuclease V) alpha subunit
MANFHLRIDSISRGAGRKVVAAAAYRSGERIRDERNGRSYNFSHRTDVTHKEILLPSGLDTAQVEWAKDRSKLWNAAERAEHRRDSRVGREFQVGLPHELSADRRRELARAFARELCDRYRVAVDLAIHDPKPEGDPRNYHAHLLLTSRELTATGFGGKAGLDMGSDDARRRGLNPGIAEIKAMRERWSSLTNEELRSAGLDVSIDHRTLRAQNIDRPPSHLPYVEILRERRGLRSEIAERMRANHAARVQARHLKDILSEPLQQKAPTRPSGLEDIRQQAREEWLRMRRDSARDRGSGSHRGDAAEKAIEQPAIEDDLSL